jgi:predicted nuclease of predicted toxin-antitoxin system
VRPADLRLLGDENIAPRTVAALRAQGFDVVRARERGLRGRPDVEVLAAAFADGRVVLSHDTDFGLLAVATGEPCVGIILIRPGDLLPEEVEELVLAFLSADLELKPPFIVVLEPGRVRVRSLS